MRSGLQTSNKRKDNRMTLFWSTVASGNILDPTVISNMMFWYKGSSLTGSNGSDITTWPDSSGNGFDLTAAGGAGNRPVVQTNAVNGNTAAKGTGTNGLTSDAAGTVPTAHNTFSLYFVFRLDATGPNEWFGFQDGSGSGMRQGADASASALYHTVIPNVGDFQSTTTLDIAGTWKRMSIVANAGTWTIKYSGATVSFSSPPNGSINGSPTGIQVCEGVRGSRALTGQLAEVIGYNKAVSAAELGILDTYAKSKYNIS